MTLPPPVFESLLYSSSTTLNSLVEGLLFLGLLIVAVYVSRVIVKLMFMD